MNVYCRTSRPQRLIVGIKRWVLLFWLSVSIQIEIGCYVTSGAIATAKCEHRVFRLSRRPIFPSWAAPPQGQTGPVLKLRIKYSFVFDSQFQYRPRLPLWRCSPRRENGPAQQPEIPMVPGHPKSDMGMIQFERVRPANNPHVRKIREKLWIARYDAVAFGANRKK